VGEGHAREALSAPIIVKSAAWVNACVAKLHISALLLHGLHMNTCAVLMCRARVAAKKNAAIAPTRRDDNFVIICGFL
jgi:hypothetical protein